MLNFIRTIIIAYTKKSEKGMLEKYLKNKMYEDYLKYQNRADYPSDIKKEMQQRIDYEKRTKYSDIYANIARIEELLKGDYFIEAERIGREVEKTFFKTPLKNRISSQWNMSEQTLKQLAMSAIIKNAKDKIKYAKDALQEDDLKLVAIKLSAVRVPDTSEIVLNPNNAYPVSLYGIPIFIDNSIKGFNLIAK